MIQRNEISFSPLDSIFTHALSRSPINLCIGLCRDWDDLAHFQVAHGITGFTAVTGGLSAL